jgi:starch synthase
VATYDAAALDPKGLIKRALQERLGLDPDPKALLACVVSRLTHQKGMDLLLEALPGFLAKGGQLAILAPAIRGSKRRSPPWQHSTRDGCLRLRL